MAPAGANHLTIAVDDTRRVSGLLLLPERARACYVLAHGAGAGMAHPFLEAVAAELGQTRHRDAALSLPLYGGRRKAAGSAGTGPGDGPRSRGRGHSARAGTPARSRRPFLWRPHDLAGTAGSPAAGCARPRLSSISAPSRRRPSDERGKHLLDVQLPMLFLQGTRDALADLPLLRAFIGRLGARATLKLLQDADHAFHVPARTGRKDADFRREILDSLAAWIDGIIAD